MGANRTSTKNPNDGMYSSAANFHQKVVLRSLIMKNRLISVLACTVASATATAAISHRCKKRNRGMYRKKRDIQEVHTQCIDFFLDVTGPRWCWGRVVVHFGLVMQLLRNRFHHRRVHEGGVQQQICPGCSTIIATISAGSANVNGSYLQQ